MKYFLILISLIFASVAEAQTSRNPCYNTTGQTGLPNCIGVGTADPLPVISQPPGGGITGNAAGSTAAVVGTLAAANFNPCIPASATNTAITITTTANGTATAVDVNSWGYQQ